MKKIILLVGCFLSLQVQADSPQATDTQLTDLEQALVARVDGWRDAMVSELKKHVDMNTGSDNIEGLDAYRTYLAGQLKELGFSTEEYSSAPLKTLNCDGREVQIADHLVARIKGKAGNRVLINGHMDTVFSKDDEFQTLSVSDDGVLKGPGVADMKGGIVIMLYALRALHLEGLLKDANITVLFNSDEEIGSLGSRPLIEALAKQHDIGLIFEGTYQNVVTRARKGLGQARLKITGREAHAGGMHQEGVSANLELAHKIIEIEKLTDYDRQMTVNTGVVSGGEKRNTIPGCADAHIDLRYPDLETGEELISAIEDIASTTAVSNSRYPNLPNIETWTVLHRPAKAPHPKVDELISEAMGISKLLGDPIVGSRYSGGGTDGSITQGVGLPTMDSLGVDGKGAHSSREESTVASLIARTKLAVVMLARQITK